jgi:hypothetical protein
MPADVLSESSRFALSIRSTVPIVVFGSSSGAATTALGAVFSGLGAGSIGATGATMPPPDEEPLPPE